MGTSVISSTVCCPMCSSGISFTTPAISFLICGTGTSTTCSSDAEATRAILHASTTAISRSDCWPWPAGFPLILQGCMLPLACCTTVFPPLVMSFDAPCATRVLGESDVVIWCADVSPLLRAKPPSLSRCFPCAPRPDGSYHFAFIRVPPKKRVTGGPAGHPECLSGKPRLRGRAGPASGLVLSRHFQDLVGVNAKGGFNLWHAARRKKNHYLSHGRLMLHHNKHVDEYLPQVYDWNVYHYFVEMGFWIFDGFSVHHVLFGALHRHCLCSREHSPRNDSLLMCRQCQMSQSVVHLS